MKRLNTFLLVFVVALCFGSGPVLAQFRHGGGGGRGFGAPRMPSEEQGRAGIRSGHSGNESSNTEVRKSASGLAGKKTTSDLLTQNTKLASNLQGLLPTGTNLQDAAKGFDHLGEFVAAVHVSHNLNIPFDQLKAKMADSSPESLGKAIQELKPNVDARKEVIKANEQALEDMKKSQS